MPPQIGPGTYITIRYEAFLESGTRVLSNEDETPLVFRFGSGEVFPRIEEEIAGLRPGDTREFLLQPEEAFGTADRSKIIRVPLDDFPRGKELKRGMVLRVETKVSALWETSRKTTSSWISTTRSLARC
jgi:FKBP-type peptidyl-prolyl cis-trans isomerase 2